MSGIENTVTDRPQKSRQGPSLSVEAIAALQRRLGTIERLDVYFVRLLKTKRQYIAGESTPSPVMRAKSLS